MSRNIYSLNGFLLSFGAKLPTRGFNNAEIFFCRWSIFRSLVGEVQLSLSSHKLYTVVGRLGSSDESEEVSPGRKNSIVGWKQKYQNEPEDIELSKVK